MITGDTLLSTNTLMSILAKGIGHQCHLERDITQAASELQLEYRNRGYPTVSVTLPQQQITNGLVKIRVFEGRFVRNSGDLCQPKPLFQCSNNVMRALPESAHQHDPERTRCSRPSWTGRTPTRTAKYTLKSSRGLEPDTTIPQAGRQRPVAVARESRIEQSKLPGHARNCGSIVQPFTTTYGNSTIL